MTDDALKKFHKRLGNHAVGDSGEDWELIGAKRFGKPNIKKHRENWLP